MIKIDIDTRCWKIPKEECFLGVESDDKVKILQFELSKNEFCDGLNFTDCNCFINYKNEGNDTIPYLITDMEVQEDGTVTFTWEVSRGATIFKGNTFAILCAKKVSDDGTITNEWNSRIGSFTVAKGIEPLSSITEVPEIDIISQLLLVAQQTNAKAETNINQSRSLLEKAEGLGYLKEDFDVLEARMNQFTSLQEGSTTGDAELIDGRIGYDGTVYDNIGGSIREQIGELKSDLADLAPLGAAIGQLFRVAAISEDGKYTMEPIDIPKYNDKYRRLASVTLEEDTNEVIISVDSLGNAFACKSIFVIGVPIFDKINSNLSVYLLSKNGVNSNPGHNSFVEGGFFGKIVDSRKKFNLSVSENFEINDSGETYLHFFGNNEQYYGERMFRKIQKMGRYFGGGMKYIKIQGPFLAGSKFDFYGIDME